MNPASPIRTKDEDRSVRDLARGTMVNLAGMAGRVSRLSATLLATHFFGAAVFGLYDTAWKVAFVFAKVARFGSHHSVVRAVVAGQAEADRPAVSRALTEALALSGLAGCLATAALILGADTFGALYDQPDLAPALRIMAWALLPLSISTVLIAATRSNRNMKYAVYVQSVGGPLLLALSTLVAGFLGAGLPGLAMTQVLAASGMLVMSIVFFERCFKGLRPSRALSTLLPMNMARFSLPVMVSDVLTTAIWSADQFVLLMFASPAQVGIYAVARQASTLLKKPTQAAGPIFGPIAAHLALTRNPEELGRHVALLLRWTLTVNLLLLGLIWLLGDRFLLVFGEQFAQGATVFWILSVGMVAYGALLPLENLLIMHGRTYVNLIYNGVWLLCLLLSLWWMVPSHAGLGAAGASTLALCTVTAMRIAHVHRLGVRCLSLCQLKPVVAAAAAASLSWLTGHTVGSSTTLATCLGGALFIVSYLLALHLLRLEPDDRMLIRRIRARFIN